jgi:hypothetical protein
MTNLVNLVNNEVNKGLKIALSKMDSKKSEIKYLCKVSENICSQLSIANKESFSDDNIGMDISIDGEIFNFCGAEIAVLTLLLTHKNVDLDPSDYGLWKWEQVEGNNWSWFVSGIVGRSYSCDGQFFFVIRLNHDDGTTESQQLALIETDGKKTADYATVCFAQSFLGGNYDDEQGAFVSGNTKQQVDSPTEISEATFVEMRSVIKTWSSIDDIPFNKEEVKYALNKGEI